MRCSDIIPDEFHSLIHQRFRCAAHLLPPSLDSGVSFTGPSSKASPFSRQIFFDGANFFLPKNTPAGAIPLRRDDATSFQKLNGGRTESDLANESGHGDVLLHNSPLKMFLIGDNLVPMSSNIGKKRMEVETQDSR